MTTIPTNDDLTHVDSDSHTSAKHADWICHQLRENGKALKEAFVDKFYDPKKEYSTSTATSAWGQATNSVRTTLQWLLVKVELRKDPKPGLYLDGSFERVRYATTFFQTNVDVAAKQKIGKTVAALLASEVVSNMSVCLGSGSTVWSIGRQLLDTPPRREILF